MRSLEGMIRPPMLARAWPRDLLWFLLLAALAAVLAPFLHVGWADLLAGGGQDESRRGRAWGELLTVVTRQMASTYLLMALGFLLCLRCGAIDASVWVVSSLGGVVAARGILAEVPTWEAMVLGVLAGAAVGAINGLLTAVARLPSIVATILTGMAILLALHWTQPQREILLPEQTFNHWHLPVPARLVAGRSEPSEGPSPAAFALYGPESQPLYVTRMLLVLGAYSLVMLLLMAGDWRRPRTWGPGSRKALWASMAASGALAAAGGVLWLVDPGRATVATRPVDNLTVPVAALLAGGAFLAGRGRTLLAAVFLPAAMLLTNLWEQNVWLYQWKGYWLQTVLLGCLLLLVQLAGGDFTAGRRAKTAGPLVSCLLAACGIVLVAAGAGASARVGRWVQLAGLLIWGLAAAILLVCRVADRKRPAA